jgi:brefeldin A-inhibited guanine nucleotide-exchange protein
MNKVLFENFKH